MASLDTWTMPEEGLQAPSISRSNEFFLKQNIEFVWGIEGIDLAELNNIFTLVLLLYTPPPNRHLYTHKSFATTLTDCARYHMYVKRCWGSW